MRRLDCCRPPGSRMVGVLLCLLALAVCLSGCDLFLGEAGLGIRYLIVHHPELSPIEREFIDGTVCDANGMIIRKVGIQEWQIRRGGAGVTKVDKTQWFDYFESDAGVANYISLLRENSGIEMRVPISSSKSLYIVYDFDDFRDWSLSMRESTDVVYYFDEGYVGYFSKTESILYLTPVPRISKKKLMSRGDGGHDSPEGRWALRVS